MNDHRLGALARCAALAIGIIGAIIGLPQAAAQNTSGWTLPMLRGVNLAGGEFGEGNIYGTDYIYPGNGSLDYYLSKGFNVFRVPFKWHRLQPELGGALSERDLAELDRIVRYAAAKDAYVVLDPHDFGRRDGFVIGETERVTSAHFADFWSRLAAHFREQPTVILGLMNEPHDQDSDILLSVLNEAIRAIRDAGSRALILVPGNSWSGAHSWVSSGNGESMLSIVDPAENYAFEPHQYLDADSSGTSNECVVGSGSERLVAFTNWAREHGKRAFLGEFGVGRNAVCYRELDALLDYVRANEDVWIGWTYWAGGPWWGEGYNLSVEPANLAAPEDRPQMSVLVEHLH